MRIAVLGTGSAGAALGKGFARLGHDVRLGSRTADNPKALAWAADVGGSAATGTFRDVCTWAELVVNATNGATSLAMLTEVGDALSGKVLIDVSNALDFSHGFPPRLSVVNDDSLGEQIQRALPDTFVVKSLNTLNGDVMLNPGLLAAPSDVFMAGEDAAAKDVVRGLLVEAGWLPENILDLGGISASRGTEMWLALWTRLLGPMDGAAFNLHLVR
jgi:8-hydroxy-5-deazaflavin:NADPH oxidoreductase